MAEDKNIDLISEEVMEEMEEKIKPGWAMNKQGHEASLRVASEADNGYVETGLEGEVPSNYENNLVGNPKGLTDFEVSKGPGRLG